MVRTIIIVTMWVATLGIFDVNITFSDGLKITLRGWPGTITRWYRNRNSKIWKS